MMTTIAPVIIHRPPPNKDPGIVPPWLQPGHGDDTPHILPEPRSLVQRERSLQYNGFVEYDADDDDGLPARG